MLAPKGAMFAAARYAATAMALVRQHQSSHKRASFDMAGRFCNSLSQPAHKACWDMYTYTTSVCDRTLDTPRCLGRRKGGGLRTPERVR